MWKFDRLETEIYAQRFWAWRHSTGSRSVGYRVQLKGAYERRRFRVYMERSLMYPYGPPEVHVVFDNAEQMTGEEIMRRARRPEDGRAAFTLVSQWAFFRPLPHAPRLLLEETVWAVYRMYENADRRSARRVLSARAGLPEDMLREIVDFI